jgi:hypothetical protein
VQTAFWAVYVAFLSYALASHPASHGAMLIGFLLGGVAGMGIALPDALMPNYIQHWEIGAWGEQKTASELEKLPRGDWRIRHDVERGTRANFDHVVAGPSVYVVNSKNVPDSEVQIDDEGRVRVIRLDDPELGYDADVWVRKARSESRAVKKMLGASLHFPVYVNPVLAIWGRFADEPRWVGEVALVRGDKLREFLLSRPADLLVEEKRGAAREAVAALPRASG